eukprot:TRINITY_DN11088_c0_g1_i1.p2 TRINITY_DN11088_c0_g1~~TRINITY_DN11088_c0_g1_i1.p2  ORF type:complete len:192 (-),score=24.45 TRINITY_DN11088_c0_g1_i1:36-575(-)
MCIRDSEQTEQKDLVAINVFDFPAKQRNAPANMLTLEKISVLIPTLPYKISPAFRVANSEFFSILVSDLPVNTSTISDPYLPPCTLRQAVVSTQSTWGRYGSDIVEVLTGRSDTSIEKNSELATLKAGEILQGSVGISTDIFSSVSIFAGAFLYLAGKSNTFIATRSFYSVYSLSLIHI